MAQTVGQHSIATFTSPTNGDPLDATVVKSNDNTTRDAYVAHDADSGIHVQSSLLSARPAAGVAGRKWMTTDPGSIKLWFDTGAAWSEISYTSTGNLTADLIPSATNTYDIGSATNKWKDVYVANNLSVNSTTLVADATANRVGIGTATPTATLDVIGAASVRSVEFDGTTSGTVTVQPAATAGTWSLTLPTTGGTAGQFLQTNGSGVATWAPQSGGFTDSAITPTVASPYSITTADADKRLLMNSTSQGAIQLLTTNTSSIAVNSKFQIASLGAGTNIYANGHPDGVTYAAPNGNVNAVVGQSDGKTIIGGTFTAVAGTARNRIARLNADGTLDTGYNPNCNSTVSAMALQSDGKLIIGGSFTTVGGTTRGYAARLNTDGTLDTSFADPAANNLVFAVAMQSDGKVLLGGAFTLIGATGRERFARMNSDGTLDTSIFANANNTVAAIAVQSDGKIILGGAFTSVAASGGTVSRNRIARMSAAATIDSFDPNPDSSVNTIAIQSDGKVVFGGSFTTITGGTRSYIARVNTDGTIDTGWTNVGVNNTVNALVVQSDGAVIAVGTFTAAGTTPAITRNRAIRFNSDGTLDPTFDLNLNTNGQAVAILSDNKVAIGGLFTTSGALVRSYVMRVYGTSADKLLAPYSFASVLGQYAVLQLEKIASGQWLITASNAS